jgi:hypothetical protein
MTIDVAGEYGGKTVHRDVYTRPKEEVLRRSGNDERRHQIRSLRRVRRADCPDLPAGT